MFVGDKVGESIMINSPHRDGFFDVGRSRIFNQNEIADAYVYYNNRVKNRRMILARVFNLLGSMWEKGGVEFGAIKEQQFNNTPVTTNPITEQ